MQTNGDDEEIGSQVINGALLKGQSNAVWVVKYSPSVCESNRQKQENTDGNYLFSHIVSKTSLLMRLPFSKGSGSLN